MFPITAMRPTLRWRWMVAALALVGAVLLTKYVEAGPGTCCLFANETLLPGESIVSPGVRRLTLLCYAPHQTNCNLFMEDLQPNGWMDFITDVNGGAYAVMQGDGNFVLYSASNQPLWSTDTHGNPGSRLQLQTDGNLVVVSASEVPLWSQW